jgi:hypothetical protein
MSEPENFLARWSRLKRQGGEPAEEEPRDHADAQDGAAEAIEPADDALSSGETPDAPPEFDLSSLPPIESITATTDIRPFLAPGVPNALRTAALRRVWVADPAIRDFIEIAENQWDFATPDSVPGFATFKPGDDIGRYVSGLTGHGDLPANRPELEPNAEPGRVVAADSGQYAEVSAGRTELPSEGDDPTSIVQRNDTDAAAPKNTNEERQAALPPRRSRGGALPQ